MFSVTLPVCHTLSPTAAGCLRYRDTTLHLGPRSGSYTLFWLLTIACVPRVHVRQNGGGAVRQMFKVDLLNLMKMLVMPSITYWSFHLLSSQAVGKNKSNGSLTSNLEVNEMRAEIIKLKAENEQLRHCLVALSCK